VTGRFSRGFSKKALLGPSSCVFQKPFILLYLLLFSDFMDRLVFKIEKDEDGVWVAEALEEGIATQGNTLDDLFTNILDTVKLHYNNNEPKVELILDMPKSTKLYA